ncbi:MAG: hypothetical protein P1U41_07610 [Vicingaceae bacterium]|nr:hypothetical protein [Vicingaceae bacterium]
MKKSIFSIFILFIASLLYFSCSKDKEVEDTVKTDDNGTCNLNSINSSSNVQGYNILDKLPGIWNGPVTSPTPLGSFTEWIVDFRPISASQISAKNELDSVNDIFMSFFIVKHDCKYKVAFRNGGGFAGNVRNSYMLIDSIFENSSESFYRFSDPVSGGNRVYTNVKFKQDSIIMTTYTNQYNNLNEPVIHMKWTANLRDTTSAQNVITLFNYPQKKLTRDFTPTFDNLSEAVFYSSAADPYPEQSQPFLGISDINITVSNPSTVNAAKKILIIITTQPLFNGINFIPANLDYRSRYVFVNAQNSTTFNFNYMHPGDYYVNAIYDNNGDLNFSSGDYMNSNFDIPLTLADKGNSNANVNINFQIP